MMELEFGDSDHHLAEFARAGGFVHEGLGT
jgi:hypothetical protein